MGLIRNGPPEDLIVKIIGEMRVLSFIETGTSHGDTAYWASNHFDHVYTIEYSKELYELAKAKYGGARNIEFAFGDSRTILPEILNIAPSPAILWLDAHWSGSNSYGEGDECPLMGELAAVECAEKEMIVLIDDARCFLSPPPSPHQIDLWPDISQILLGLKRVPLVDYVAVFDDVIIGVPEVLKRTVQEHCQDRATQIWRERKKELASYREREKESVSYYMGMAVKQMLKKLGGKG